MSNINASLMKEELFELSTVNLYGFDPDTGLEIAQGTLESHQLERAVESEKIKGGIDNNTYTVIDKASELTLTTNDVMNRRDILAMKLGGMKNGKVTVKHLPENYDVKAEANTLVVDLGVTPLDNTKVNVYDNATGAKMTVTTDYTIEGTKIKIVKSGIKASDTIFVTGFDYEITADYMDIPATSSIKSMQIILEKPIWNSKNEIVFWKQYIFPKATLEGGFKDEGNTEKGKNVQETKFTITKDGNETSLGKIVYIPANAGISARMLSDEDQEEAEKVISEVMKRNK